jgi:DNA-binding protein H-NS
MTHCNEEFSMPRRSPRTRTVKEDECVDEREAIPVIPVEMPVETQSPRERINFIEEHLETLTAQELLTVRKLAEQMRKKKLKEAKAALLGEMRGKLSEQGLTLSDVFPTRRGRKRNRVSPVKYRSPNGASWTGIGAAPNWLKQLEAQGHRREEFTVTEG